ncbi:MAG TPA: alpha/beta fold hydrolase [Ktedonobacterales bacterium]|nr:alpha/beta fold hydrolase [Ktedonobacterales bacterium]
MPTTHVNGAQLYYEEHGAGPETIVFAHGLFWSGEMFAAQVAALQDRYRCVTFDFRGQGQSEMTRDGYDMETLAEDAAALIRQLGLAPCHFAGLSMGGFIGMRLALRQPELLRSLILLETSADPEPAENLPSYRKLLTVAQVIGLHPVAGRVMPTMFGQTFMRDPARAQQRAEWQARLAGNQRPGILNATRGVLDRVGVADQLDQIRTPTLIIVGDEDVATKPDRAQRMAERIPGARLVTIPHAGHTSTVEEPAAVTAAIEAFLAGH